MRKGDGYTIGFAAVVCVVCSLLLAVISSSLQARQEQNAALNRQRNILKAFGIQPEDGRKNISAERVQQLFKDHIDPVVLDGESGDVVSGLAVQEVEEEDLESRRRLPLYRWQENGMITRYAFPVSGKGLWSTINGYLALDSDLKTILGITFYDHGETPGLGGEIDKDWFQEQFRGKKITENGELTPIRVVKGSAPDDDPHAVDGISGATMTSKGVQAFLNEELARYNKYFSRKRG